MPAASMLRKCVMLYMTLLSPGVQRWWLWRALARVPHTLWRPPCAAWRCTAATQPGGAAARRNAGAHAGGFIIVLSMHGTVGSVDFKQSNWLQMSRGTAGQAVTVIMCL
jgi:hypothetical protein